MGNQKTLDSAGTGSVLRYRGEESYVAEKAVNRESGTYLEKQWTLRSTLGADRYLVKSEEKKASGLEVIWVLTSAIRLGSVTGAEEPGGGSAFPDPDAMPETPPRAVGYNGGVYTFAGKSSVKAADDDGDMVTKITFDYYSGDRRRNLAIEIWKEPDKDYPEAFLGDVVNPAEFELLDKKVDVIKTIGNNGFSGPLPELQAGFSVVGLAGLVVLVNGMPIEYIIGFGVPAALIFAMCLLVSASWLRIATGALLAVVALAAYIGRFALPFWHIAFGCLVVSAMLPRLIGGFYPGERLSGHFRVSLYGVLPALWLYSFTEYLFFAPGPHASYQFLAAALLPSGAAAVCALVNFMLEGNDARP